MTEKPITLSFTAKQLDYIAQVLQQRPYVEVAPLLAAIQQQIDVQPPPPASAKRNGRDPNPPKELQQ